MSELPDVCDVIVVGAGLAGLAAARHLHAQGRSVCVLEADDGVGGRVRTDLVDGFRLDRGFQVLLTAYPELERQLDLAALRLQPFESGAMVWLEGKGHVVGDPRRHPKRLWSTATAPIGSPMDKARILGLQIRLLRSSAPELLRQSETSTLVALRAAGFSQRMIDRFFRPLVAGIQLDPALGTSSRMFDVIFRSLAGGSSAVPASGMGAVPEQLAAGLPAGSVHLSTPVAQVAPGRVTTTDGRVVSARAVVVATEGPVATRLVGTRPVGSRSVGAVYFAADRAPIQDRLVVLDGTSAGPVLNAAVMSNVARTYAPEGRHLVVAALPGVVDGDLEAAARAQFRSWWGPQVDAWQHLRTYRIPHGQPDQSPPFSPKRRVALGDGLFVCGDHRDTGSIQGALFSGRRCGEAVSLALA